MSLLNAKKTKVIFCSILYFTMIISISSIFSPKLLYGQDIDTNSLTMEDSDYVQPKQNNYYYSDNNHTDVKFNFAVAADWGCEEDTKKTAENIQSKNPELVISAGDQSYDESADCWLEIIQPFMSKMMIAWETMNIVIPVVGKKELSINISNL